MRARVLQAVAALVLITVVTPVVLASIPALVGADHAYIVQFDSMRPALTPGALVFVSEVSADEIQEGDVITYSKAPGTETTTTHRVVERYDDGNGSRFETRGDANDHRDAEPVSPDEVVGVVLFSVPLAGHIVTFATTTVGWLLGVFVPTLVAVTVEILCLRRQGRVGRNRLENERRPES